MRTSRPLEAGSPTHSFLCKMESFLHSQWETYQSKETGGVHTVGPLGLPRPKKRPNGMMCTAHLDNSASTHSPDKFLWTTFSESVLEQSRNRYERVTKTEKLLSFYQDAFHDAIITHTFSCS